MSIKRIALVLSVMASLTAAHAAGPAYPNKPIRIVVPAAPGGGSDMVTRMIARQLSESLRESVIVDNRPAVDGIAGTETVAHAAPDGYTLLVASSSHSINVALGRKLPYDTIRDFAPVTQTTNQHLLLVVNPSLPVETVKELVEYLRVRPGKLNYASSSNGTALPMELFKNMTGTDAQHVPYKGSGPLMIALLGGQVQMSMAGALAAVPHVKAGKLRALGIGALKRSAFLPDVPTIAESGVPGYEAVIWTGMFAPAKTPRAITERLNKEVVRILRAPDFSERIRSQGADVVGDTPDEWGKFISSEIKKWTEIARIAGLKSDQ